MRENAASDPALIAETDIIPIVAKRDKPAFVSCPAGDEHETSAASGGDVGSCWRCECTAADAPDNAAPEDVRNAADPKTIALHVYGSNGIARASQRRDRDKGDHLELFGHNLHQSYEPGSEPTGRRMPLPEVPGWANHFLRHKWRDVERQPTACVPRTNHANAYTRSNPLVVRIIVTTS